MANTVSIAFSACLVMDREAFYRPRDNLLIAAVSVWP